MNAGLRNVLKQIFTLTQQSRLLTNSHRPVRETVRLLRDRKTISRSCQMCCFSTSRILRNDKNDSEDTSETEFFDRFYQAVTERAKNNSYTLQKIQKGKFAEAYKKRAIKRWTFEQVVEIYVKQNPNRRRHVEFIYEALDRIVELGLERDIKVYKKLLMAFPQDGRMVTESRLMADMKYYPKQQDCAIDLLDQMVENGVLPDLELMDMIMALFGSKSHPYRKLRRTVYWAQKFHNANPYQLPFHLPDDEIELAVLALKKMVIDLQNEMHIWQIKEPEETFIVSAQSCNQRELLKQHKTDSPIYVEGGYSVWLRDTSLTYFVMKSESDPALFPEVTLDEEDEGLFHFETVFDSEKPKAVMPRPSEHQQEDGTVLAMCITGSSSKESLIQWVRLLQESNPSLAQKPIVFRLKSPVEAEDIQSIESPERNGDLTPV